MSLGLIPLETGNIDRDWSAAGGIEDEIIGPEVPGVAGWRGSQEVYPLPVLQGTITWLGYQVQG